VITGLGQVKAAGIHNGQGRFCIHAAVVFHHVDLLAVHGSGSGHQLVFQMFLGHIFEITGVLDDFGIPGVILDQAQYIGFIDVAQAGGFRFGNDHIDTLFQHNIAAVGAHLGHGVGVIFQTLEDDLTLGIGGLDGDKMGGIRLVGHMIHHIVNAFVLVQLRLHKVVVSFVLDQELHLGEVTLTIGEQLGEVNAVC